MSRNRERGSAMLVTLILVAALLAGAAVLVSMQLASNKSTDLSRTSMSSLHCAEAGLALARSTVQSNSSSWNTGLSPSGAISTSSEPGWLHDGIEVAAGNAASSNAAHDLDGDGNRDLIIYLKDNHDEGSGSDAQTADADGRVWVVSRCIKYADTVKEVEELVEMSGAASCYQAQEGGCFGNGNSN